MIAGLSDLLIGRDPLDHVVISRELAARAWWFGPEGIASFARSAIDIALWDLRGKVSGQSLVQMLGGAVHERLPVIASTHAFMPSLEDEAARHASYTAAGFHGFKIGLGKKGEARVGYEFERDLQFMKLLREAAGPGPDIMFDRGQHLKWDAGHAVKLTKAWEEYGLRWIEEPLEPWDIQGFKQLRSHCTSLVATGERCWTTEQYHRLIATGIVDVIGCDPGRAGGITGFRELIAAVEHAQLWFNAHAWSSAIISAASLGMWTATSRAQVRRGSGSRSTSAWSRSIGSIGDGSPLVQRLRLAGGESSHCVVDHSRPRIRRRRHRAVRRCHPCDAHVSACRSGTPSR
jgi:L-alanine-DL-glutamate epimerase-like enolase superfamily enzyme